MVRLGESAEPNNNERIGTRGQLDGPPPQSARQVAEVRGVLSGVGSRLVRVGELEGYRISNVPGAMVRVSAHTLKEYLERLGKPAYEWSRFRRYVDQALVEVSA